MTWEIAVITILLIYAAGLLLIIRVAQNCERHWKTLTDQDKLELLAKWKSVE